MNTTTRTEYTTTWRGQDLGLAFTSSAELASYVASGVAQGNDPAGYGPTLVRTVTLTRTVWTTEPEGPTCRDCGTPLEVVPGVGWVDAVSGDHGGTYDICPERYDAEGDTTFGHRRA